MMEKERAGGRGRGNEGRVGGKEGENEGGRDGWEGGETGWMERERKRGKTGISIYI